MIPKRLIRVVPEHTTVECDNYWDRACRLHPTWEHVTLRDPIDPDHFPLTRHVWRSCESGAQLADLVRLEEIYRRGGVYIDSDIEVLQPLDMLLGNGMFAGWQDTDYVCNAVFGAIAGHLAVGQVIELSLNRHQDGTLWSGVMAFNEVVKFRKDVLLLPPASFFPYHWTAKSLFDQNTVPGRHNREELLKNNPWSYCVDHWHDSWEASRERRVKEGGSVVPETSSGVWASSA